MGETCSKPFQLDSQSKTKTLGDQSVAILYQNGIFTLPSKMPFQTQSTYAKIQKAAYNFCQQNQIDLDFMPSITRVIAYRQEKVFLAAFSKTPQRDKETFLEEVSRIPQDQIDLFYHNFINETHKKYSLTGHSKKTQGKTFALVIMCAGSSSRFDSEDKFLAPLNLKVNPKLTILDMIFIRLKLKIDSQPPIVITCNELNFTKIQNFLRQRNYFGLNKQKFRFMQVQCLPVLDINGKYCVNEKYRLIKRPFGTGRTVNEILKERNLIWLKQCGVRYVHLIGAQNLMEQPCDELMLGVMQTTKKKIMGKCVGTGSQWEKLPRYVASKQNTVYFKYWSQLTSSIPEQAQNTAYKFPVATNSITVQLSYLQQLVKDFYTDIYLSENYHVIRRREKMMSISNNKLVVSESLTFQGDIRDLLACCKDPGLLYVARNKAFTPVISKNEDYSLGSSVDFHQKHLTDEYLSCKGIQDYFYSSKNVN